MSPMDRVDVHGICQECGEFALSHCRRLDVPRIANLAITHLVNHLGHYVTIEVEDV